LNNTEIQKVEVFKTMTKTMSSLLSIPRVHTTYASRCFSIAALLIWNSLLSDIHCLSSHAFHLLLKTHCFEQAYTSL